MIIYKLKHFKRTRSKLLNLDGKHLKRHASAKRTITRAVKKAAGQNIDTEPTSEQVGYLLSIRNIHTFNTATYKINDNRNKHFIYTEILIVDENVSESEV